MSNPGIVAPAAGGLPRGPLAARPPASGSGRTYVATDVGTTPVAYMDLAVGFWQALGGGPQVSPIDPKYLQKWHAASAKARVGAAQPTIACVGDSTTEASNLGGDIVTGASWPARFTTLMNNFIPTVQSWAKPLHAGGTVPTDSRVVMSGGFAYGGNPGFTNDSFKSTTNGGKIAFTPPLQTDTLDVIYLGGGSLGTFTVDIGGAALTTVNTATTANVYKSTTTTTKGSNTWNITSTVAASGVFITMIRAYDSTTGNVHIFNLGAGFGTAQTFYDATATNWAIKQHVDVLQPDLTIIMLGINNAGGVSGNPPDSLAQYLYSMGQVVSQWKTYGDVLLCNFMPSTGVGYVTQEQRYIEALPAFAAAQGVAYADIPFGRWGGSWATVNTLGLTSADSLHPNANGYMDIAQALAGLLRVA